MFQNATFLAKPMTPPEEIIYIYIYLYISGASGGIWCPLESSGVIWHTTGETLRDSDAETVGYRRDYWRDSQGFWSRISGV